MESSAIFAQSVNFFWNIRCLYFQHTSRTCWDCRAFFLSYIPLDYRGSSFWLAYYCHHEKTVSILKEAKFVYWAPYLPAFICYCSSFEIGCDGNQIYFRFLPLFFFSDRYQIRTSSTSFCFLFFRFTLKVLAFAPIPSIQIKVPLAWETACLFAYQSLDLASFDHLWTYNLKENGLIH